MTKMELKPCPFCGVSVDLCQHEDDPKYVSHPQGNCILARSIWRYRDPVKQWNTRSQ